VACDIFSGGVAPPWPEAPAPQALLARLPAITRGRATLSVLPFFWDAGLIGVPIRGPCGRLRARARRRGSSRGRAHNALLQAIPQCRVSTAGRPSNCPISRRMLKLWSNGLCWRLGDLWQAESGFRLVKSYSYVTTLQDIQERTKCFDCAQFVCSPFTKEETRDWNREVHMLANVACALRSPLVFFETNTAMNDK